MNKTKLFNENQKKLTSALERVNDCRSQFVGSNSMRDQRQALIALQDELEALDLLVDIQLIKYKNL